MKVTETRFAAPGVRSLLWHRDVLFDYIGGSAYDLSGERRRLSTSWAHRFDSATASPSGHFVALYERLGTEGMLLYDGAFLRPLSRSRYEADTYEYPICLFALPSGRELLAHCPDESNKLELEDAESGKVLTRRTNEPSALYHSRLSANARGTRLISAGWFSVPYDAVAFLDIKGALGPLRLLDSPPLMGLLNYPRLLDAPAHSGTEGSSEVSNAAWLTKNRAAIYSHPESDDLGNIASIRPRLTPDMLAVYDVEDKCYLSRVRPAAIVGTMHAIDAGHVLGLYDHPKVVRLSDGAVLQTWPHLKTGTQLSSIANTRVPPPPPMAFDARRLRFAVADEEGVTVLTFEPRVAES